MSENPAQKFQREMQKLGLGVSIQVRDEPSVTVTTWCAGCNHVTAGAPESCPKCGKPLPFSVVSGEGQTAQGCDE